MRAVHGPVGDQDAAQSHPRPPTDQTSSGNGQRPAHTEVSVTAPGQSSSAPSSNNNTLPDLKTLLEAEETGMSKEDKERRLERFQMFWLNAEQQRQFEELFSQGIYDVDNALYNNWVVFKRKALGTISEAVDNVLEAKMPSNVPYRKRKYQDRMPKGSSRYDPLSQEMRDYMEEVEAKNGR